jgi:hypothetical protein
MHRRTRRAVLYNSNGGDSPLAYLGPVAVMRAMRRVGARDRDSNARRVATDYELSTQGPAVREAEVEWAVVFASTAFELSRRRNCHRGECGEAAPLHED